MFLIRNYNPDRLKLFRSTASITNYKSEKYDFNHS